MTTTPRKTWNTPQIFVLGAEGTRAYSANAASENVTGHVPGGILHTFSSNSSTIGGSTVKYDGYES